MRDWIAQGSTIGYYRGLGRCAHSGGYSRSVFNVPLMRREVFRTSLILNNVTVRGIQGAGTCLLTKMSSRPTVLSRVVLPLPAECPAECPARCFLFRNNTPEESDGATFIPGFSGVFTIPGGGISPL